MSQRDRLDNSVGCNRRQSHLSVFVGVLIALVSYFARVKSLAVTAPNVPLVNLPARTGQVLAIILACVYAGDAAAQSNQIEFQICPYDTGLEDGDYVHIWFNNYDSQDRLFDDHPLTKREVCKTLTRPEGLYQITVKAINEGTRSPNTAAIRLKVAGTEKAEADWDLDEGEVRHWQVEISEDDITMDPLALSPSVSNVIAEEKGVATLMVDRSTGDDASSDRTVKLTLGGNAIQGTDYRVLSEELTIIKGRSSVSADIVEAMQDKLVEGNETIVITAWENNEEVGSVEFTIEDDDMAAWSLGVPSSITEAAGAVTVTVDAGGVTFGSDQPIALTVSPNAANDLSGVPTEVKLPVTASTVTATINVTDDKIVEDTETFTITAWIGVQEVDSAQLTIRDDDVAAWSLSVPAPITEASGEVEITVDTGGVTFGSEQTIALTVSPNAANDLSGVPTEVTLPVTASTVTATINVTDDKIVEDTETFTITASIGVQEVDSAQLTILDDDMSAWSLSVPASITEASGDVMVRVDTGGVTFGSDQPIALTVSPNAANDFSGLPTQLSLPKGEREASATIKVTNDDIVEGDETFTITASIGGAAVDSAQLTILNDDLSAWSLSVDDASITEAPREVTVTVNTGGVTFDDDQTIALTVSPNAANDLSGVPTEVTLPARASTVSATINVTDDDIVEGDETFTIIASIGGAAVDSAQLTILNDDEAAWSLDVSPASIVEASGSATVTVSTGDVTFNSDQAITLSVAQGSTASAGEDFEQLQTLTLVAGANTVSTTIEAIPDEIVEGDETIVVSASSGGEAVGSSQTLTIEDDDQAEIKVTEAVLILSEGTPDSQGAVGTFSIELGSQPASPVTVTVRSSDVSAVTVTPTSPLRFTSRDWNVAQDVTVHAVEDSDADNEMVTITYEVNGPGAYAGLVPDDDVMVMVQVIDDDVSQPERELVEVTVRTVTATTVSNITTNIGARFSAARTGTSLTSLSLAGQAVTQSATFEETSWNALWNQESHSRTLSSDELLRSTDFQIVLGASESAQAPTAETWTFWGRGDFQYFSSQPSQGSSYDGDLRAGYFGLDTQVDDQWLAGVAVSRTMAEANYALGTGGADNDGTMDVTLTSLIPYVRFAPDEESELWAIVGVGRGEIENNRPNAAVEQESSKAAMLMASAGGRHAVALGDPLDWALLGDVGFGQVLTEDGVEAIAGLTVDTWQARLGVEGSYTADLGYGRSITAFMEVAGRYDGGDEGETGLELSPGMYIATPDTGFGFELRGRALVLHSAENYEEYGLSATASVTPRSDGTGFSLSLSPRWGDDTGGADTLWRDDGLGLLGSSSNDRNAISLDARVGYGVKAMNGLLTPFSEFGLREEDSQYWRIGARFDRTRAKPGALSLELSGERRERLGGDHEHRVGLISRMQF